MTHQVDVRFCPLLCTYLVQYLLHLICILVSGIRTIFLNQNDSSKDYFSLLHILYIFFFSPKPQIKLNSPELPCWYISINNRHQKHFTLYQYCSAEHPMLERSQDDNENFLLQRLKTLKNTLMRPRMFPGICKKKPKPKNNK